MEGGKDRVKKFRRPGCLKITVKGTRKNRPAQKELHRYTEFSQTFRLVLKETLGWIKNPGKKQVKQSPEHTKGQ